MTGLLLLGPGTPMLFQGQEFSASAPFLFFADHPGELGEQIRRGRAEFLLQFPSLATAEMQAQLADPTDPRTFERSKLDLEERERHAAAYRLHGDLLALRRADPMMGGSTRLQVDGAVLGARLFVLRYFGQDGMDRLLVVNLGRDTRIEALPEPLLAPVEGLSWTLMWSSEHPAYGGGGTPDRTEEVWRIPAESTTLWASAPTR
jgi:maltooligosyltrehalose trehalohydrolase